VHITPYLSPDGLRRRLRTAGLSNEIIDAAWPQWWTEDAVGSPAAEAELRFGLARRLGLSPSALLNEEPVFLWRDQAKYKSLTANSLEEESAITSYGLVIGRSMITATPSRSALPSSAAEIRSAILAESPVVTALDLLTLCWAVGIPVVHPRVFPLESKRMHAMSIRYSDRYAVILGAATNYAAALAFTLAHELGHIVLGHFNSEEAVVDMGDPAREGIGNDSDEAAASRFALELIGGSPDRN
jgi:hypothetical protein